MKLREVCAGAFAFLALCGCAGTQTPPSRATPAAPAAANGTEEIRTKLVGTWQYQNNGLTIEVTYTPTTVSMPGVPPSPYTLVGNEITIDILGPKTSVIEFRGKDEMAQTNKTDGQRYVFKRKPSA